MAELSRKEQIIKLINTHNTKKKDSDDRYFAGYTGKGRNIFSREAEKLVEDNERLEDNFSTLIEDEYAENGNSSIIVDVQNLLLNRKQPELLFYLIETKLRHHDMNNMEELMTTLITQNHFLGGTLVRNFPNIIPTLKNILENTKDIDTLIGLAFLSVYDKNYNSVHAIDINDIAEKVYQLHDLKALNKFGGAFGSDSALSKDMRAKLRDQYNELSNIHSNDNSFHNDSIDESPSM